jgi:hypothetical protein
MIAQVIRDRLGAPEFHPFALVLANGERLDIRHRDSLAWPFTMVGQRRVYSPFVVAVVAEGDEVLTRSISVPLIAQVIDEHRTNGG